jgi:shikimate kinase
MSRLFFLIGFMGAGKTTVGRAAADALGYTFLDLDDLIEQREEKTIREIFETEGEAYFREMESAILKSLEYLPSANYIIATGGGTPCFKDNVQWMKAHGRVYYIQLTVEELSQRLWKGMDKRPLLKGLELADLQLFISNLLKKREVYYRQAHHHIPNPSLPPTALIELINGPKMGDTGQRLN